MAHLRSISHKESCFVPLHLLEQRARLLVLLFAPSTRAPPSPTSPASRHAGGGGGGRSERRRRSRCSAPRLLEAHLLDLLGGPWLDYCTRSTVDELAHVAQQLRARARERHLETPQLECVVSSTSIHGTSTINLSLLFRALTTRSRAATSSARAHPSTRDCPGVPNRPTARPRAAGARRGLARRSSVLTPSACRRSAPRWSFGDFGFGDFFFFSVAAPLADLGLVLLLDRLPGVEGDVRADTRRKEGREERTERRRTTVRRTSPASTSIEVHAAIVIRCFDGSASGLRSVWLGGALALGGGRLRGGGEAREELGEHRVVRGEHRLRGPRGGGGEEVGVTGGGG